jgi:hypothetical protein
LCFLMKSIMSVIYSAVCDRRNRLNCKLAFASPCFVKGAKW